MFLQQPWCSGDLIERARRRAGLQDFGDTQFQQGLEVFLRACAEEADLSLFGRLGTRWDIARLLSNLLRLHDEELRSPGILDDSIVQPIFITGLPRSGTTFLHQLLTADEGNLVPRVWQLIHPYPTRRDQAASDRRRLRVARQLRMFQLLSPQFRQMHPIGADSPQECSEITAHIFASPRFDTTYNVPSYRRWLDGIGHLRALEFHKRFLQHLQHQSGRRGRWVLKCPDHVFALAEIRAVYPDARFVFVHRDPLRVMASVARLTEVLRRPFTRHVDRVALGHQECERWSLGAELMVRAAEEEPFAKPIFHLHYNELVGDPVASVENLYRHFGITLAPSVASNIARIVKSNPNGGYGANRYRFDEYGIDANEIRKRFTCYLARFGSSAEPERSRRGLPTLITASAELSIQPGD
ncbi:MAG TPA: sulfotransferase [Bradyrhizobium sp.]|nr:sulfotransferase [Bradyrhizobium sp.]